MPAVMRASAVIERAGVPVVAIGARGFERMGAAVGRSFGIPQTPIAVYPGVILTDQEETFRQKVSETVATQVIDGLLAREQPVEDAPEVREYRRTEIVVSGSLDDIQERFLAEGWSEGIPIMPPTMDRIEQFLQFSDRNPDEVIGVLLPEKREATVWNVAVNGVMAGCRPEYFPLLLAVVECIADPRFRIEDAGSTPGWEPLVVVSGPVVKQLNFNYGIGVMRVGRQANTSIGRFTRLFMRNVPGLRIPPGDTDQGAIAYSFNVALAEDEDAVLGLGWEPYRVDRGFDVGSSVVSVQSVVNISAPIYSGGEHATDHLETIARLFANAVGPWAFTGPAHGAFYPLLVLGPSIAAAMQRDGVSKQDIRQYLYDNARTTAGWLEKYAPQVGRTGFSLAEQVDKGVAPRAFALSDDPERLVPLFMDPEALSIVVAGNPGRNQSKAYVNNHDQGAPVSRRVNLPSDWEDRLASRS